MGELGMDRESQGESYEETQCPVPECTGEYAGTDICPYGCSEYTGGISGDN